MPVPDDTDESDNDTDQSDGPLVGGKPPVETPVEEIGEEEDPNERVQCQGITLKNKPCNNWIPRYKGPNCKVHKNQEDEVDDEEDGDEVEEEDPMVQCGGLTKAGARCLKEIHRSKGLNCHLHKKQE